MSNSNSSYSGRSGAGKHEKSHRDCDDRDDCDDCDDGCMQPWVAYLIWFIVFIVLIAILRAFKIRWFSTIVFSLVVSLIVLSFIYPFKTNKRNGKHEYCSDDAFFGFLCVITIILLIIWIIWKVFSDRECHPHSHHVAHSDKSIPDGQASWNWDIFASSSKGQTVASGHGNVSHTSAGATNLSGVTTQTSVARPVGSPF